MGRKVANGMCKGNSLRQWWGVLISSGFCIFMQGRAPWQNDKIASTMAMCRAGSWGLDAIHAILPFCYYE
jgi:hypothetical protein